MENESQNERDEAAEMPEGRILFPDDTIRVWSQEEAPPTQAQADARTRSAIWWTFFWCAALALLAWPLGLAGLLRESLLRHGADWLTGALCLVWLLILLKAPWDLYFQAREVAFEQERALERKIAVAPERMAYLRRLQKALAALAVGSHLASALFVAALTRYAGGSVGYYFAALYLIATCFRPLAAAYVYLTRKLFAIGRETRYPREDVTELFAMTRRQQNALREAQKQIKTLRVALDAEAAERREEQNALRQKIYAMSREFEATLTRLTDNQDVIKGIQAFARLMAQSAPPA